MKKLLVFLLLLLPNCSFAGFPSTSVLDSGTRANEGPPPSANWTKPTYGTFDGVKILSNAFVTATTNANDCMAYWNVADFGPDSEAYITVAAANSDTFIILHARFDITLGNGYKIDWDGGTSRVRVFRVDTGTRTQLGADITQAMSSGDSIGMRIRGTTIEVWYKASGGSWALIGSRADSTYTSAGKIMIGMWNQNTGATFTNFGGGTVTGAVTGMLQIF